MNAQEARQLASLHRESLCAFLQGVFGDAPTADKFVRFTLQRLEVDFDEIECDPQSPRALFVLAREACREYTAAATFARLPLSIGDDGLPLAGVLPSAPAVMMLALPRTARLALKLLVVDGLAPADIEPLFGFTPARFAKFVERIGAALPDGGKLTSLAEPLKDPAVLSASDPVAVAVRSSDAEPVSAETSGAPDADKTQPGTRVTQEEIDAARAELGRTNVGARKTKRSENPLIAAASGSAPRGVSLSPLVTGGHPANRGPRPFERPPAPSTLPPVWGSERSPAIAAGLLVFLGLAALPLLNGFLERVQAPRPVKTPASVAASPCASPAARKGIATLELRSGSVPVADGQEVRAGGRGEAHVVMDGVQIWLTPGSRANIHADRVVLNQGVARVEVVALTGFVGVVDPLQFKMSPGTYVLRHGGKAAAGLATLAGSAECVSEQGRGMRAEVGRSVTLGGDGAAETRDLPARLDDSWGREAARIAQKVADTAHFAALADTSPAGAASGAARGGGGRPLFSATGGGGSTVGKGVGGDRGPAGYRSAF